MDWKAEGGKDVLHSIAARLLALADLAERVASRSFLIRWLALWYVWQADAVARDFVAGSEWNPAGRLWSPALPAVRYGIGAADAMVLAVSLRALAGVVLDMAAQRRRAAFVQQASDASCDGNPIYDLDAVVRTLWRSAFPPVEICDTS
jgi:hypothetical protein